MKLSRMIPSLIAIVLILAGGFMALEIYEGYREGREVYRDLSDEYTKNRLGDNDGDENPLPEDAPERIEIEWDQLLEDYPGIVAWIQLPAIDLSYPVMQAEDNDYFLHRAPDGEYLYAGSIFLDYQCSAAFQNYNSIIYGHNMRDGSMFGTLKRYNDPEVFEECPYFWVYTPYGDNLYRIFSVHVAATGGDTYIIRFGDYEKYADWLTEMSDATEVETGERAEAGDTVVTLSTCNSNESTRQVVQGYVAWTDLNVDEAMVHFNDKADEDTRETG